MKDCEDCSIRHTSVCCNAPIKWCDICEDCGEHTADYCDECDLKEDDKPDMQKEDEHNYRLYPERI